MADSYDDMEDEARFDSMLGGPSSPKVANPHAQESKVVLGLDGATTARVEVAREPGYYEAKEVPPRQRFRFELNIGTGERDLLDADNEDRYVPMKLTDYAATAMLQLLNTHPEIAETQGWQRGRADVSDQVMDAVQVLHEATLKIKQYGFQTADPREELVKLKKMLTDRGI